MSDMGMNDRVLRINPHLRVISVTDNEIVAKHGTRSAFARTWRDHGRTGFLGSLIRAIDGKTSVRALIAGGLCGEADVADARALVAELVEANVLVGAEDDVCDVYLRTIQGADQPLTDQRVGIVGCGQLGSRIARHLVQAGVGYVTLLDDARAEDVPTARRLLGLHPDSVQPGAHLARCLSVDLDRLAVRNIAVMTDDGLTEQAFTTLFERCDFVVAALDEYLVSVLDAINEAALTAEKPWVMVAMDGSEGIAGPLFVPGDTCCFSEFEIQGVAASGMMKRDVLTFRDAEYGRRRAMGVGLPPYVDILCGQAAAGALSFLATGRSFLLGRAIRTDFERMSVDYEDIRRLPRCPACGPFRPFRNVFL
jgi:bacteriocin biosynthesis cyclodehydratase domain-containing protein